MARLLLLLVCVTGILIPYTQYGVLQERIYKQPYGDSMFREYIFVIFIQMVVNAAVSYAAILLQRPKPSEVPMRQYFQIAGACVGATFASSAALGSVAYPTQVLSKSFKLVPVMMMGSLVSGRRYSAAEYLAVVLITAGVLVYSCTKGPEHPSQTGNVENSAIGLMWLAISLFCDGFIGPKQEALKQKYRPSEFQLMLGTNICGAILLLPPIAYFQSMQTVVDFAKLRPELTWDLSMLCAYSAIGQIFVFLTISKFDALQLTIITTIRKFLTIIASILVFGHELSALQYAAIASVFVGTVVHAHDSVSKKSSPD